jgi:hypothetical protein
MEGHGELPADFYHQPQPVAQLSVMASTTSSGSLNILKLPADAFRNV